MHIYMYFYRTAVLKMQFWNEKKKNKNKKTKNKKQKQKPIKQPEQKTKTKTIQNKAFLYQKKKKQYMNGVLVI